MFAVRRKLPVLIFALVFLPPLTRGPDRVSIDVVLVQDSVFEIGASCEVHQGQLSLPAISDWPTGLSGVKMHGSTPALSCHSGSVLGQAAFDSCCNAPARQERRLLRC
jgi:hypothetical protein